MLPNIDPAANAANVTVTQTIPQPQARRAEADRATRAYANPAVPGEQRAPADQARIRDDARRNEAVETQKAADSATSKSGRLARPKTDSYPKQPGDQAEINFQMTREEREAFLNAMSGQEDPSDMTEQEQTALQRAAERIDKLLENAATRQTDRGDRLDKAVREWYSRLSNGKAPPPDLLVFIRQAAAGNMNFKNIGALDS